MNDEGIEGKKTVLLFSPPFSIVTLHSAPLNRNRHSQAEEGRKEKGSRSSLLPLSSAEKQDFLSLHSHQTFDINGRPNLLLADWIFQCVLSLSSTCSVLGL